jgi:hypothetical protein
MNTYLLLRNNKESGPFSLDDLIKMGIKPYDLVWVYGKSAAWRYPSEVEELKMYAPVTEEQPYDRFYKKPNVEKTVADIPQNEPVKIDPRSQEKINNQPSITVTNETGVPAAAEKKVFVSLPGKPDPQKTIPVQQPSIPAFNESKYESYLPVSPSRPSTIQPKEETPELEERFSQPLDEIKEMYVQTLADRKKRLARKNFLKNNSLTIAVVLGVLAIGMLIGYAFSSGKEAIVSSSATHPASPVNNEADSQFVSDEPQEIITDAPENSLQANEKINTTSTDKNENYQATKNKNLQVIIPAKDDSYDSNANQQAATGVISDPVTGERKRVMRDETTTGNESSAQKTSIENIWQDVLLKASDYKTGPFGGVRDLHIVLTNKSSLPLDKVEVEVKYIGMEKQVVKTQTMVFNDIAPGGQVRSEVPRSNRGMSVDCSIKKIDVRDFSFARSGSK